MTQQFTASEVRDAITWKYGDKLTRISAMLTAFADLLEAREKAVPVRQFRVVPKGSLWTDVKDDEIWTAVTPHPESYETRILYTHPAPSDAERLAEALRRTCRKMKTFSRTGALDGAVAVWVDEIEVWVDEIESVPTAHSPQAQPPATRVTDAMVERAVKAWTSNGFGNPGQVFSIYNVAKVMLEAALAAQPMVTDVKVRASAPLDFLESDFGQSGRDVRVEAIACELCATSLPDASWFSSEVCEARNQWAQRHEMNWLETDENHPDDFIGKWIRDKLLAAQENPNG